MLAEAGARDDGDLIADALRAGPPSEPRRRPRRFEHVLVDDAQELDLAPRARWRWRSAARDLTVAGDPIGGAAALPRRRRAADCALLERPERARRRRSTRATAARSAMLDAAGARR